MDPSTLTGDLRRHRDELAQELERLTAPPEPGSAIAFGKRIGEGTTEAIERLSTTATARSIATSLADTDRALEKVADGTYGRCDVCEEPIPDERMEARPTTAHCVGCSAKR
jgi:DnaK suppressor protein